jgi:hypothetical protein
MNEAFVVDSAGYHLERPGGRKKNSTRRLARRFSSEVLGKSGLEPP